MYRYALAALTITYGAGGFVFIKKMNETIVDRVEFDISTNVLEITTLSESKKKDKVNFIPLNEIEVNHPATNDLIILDVKNKTKQKFLIFKQTAEKIDLDFFKKLELEKYYKIKNR